MEFDPWDPNKEAVNKAKHGVGFDDARVMFALEPKVFPANIVDGEAREMAIAHYRPNRLWTLVFHRRDGKCRPISFRPSNEKEVKLYEKA